MVFKHFNCFFNRVYFVHYRIHVRRGGSGCGGGGGGGSGGGGGDGGGGGGK